MYMYFLVGYYSLLIKEWTEWSTDHASDDLRVHEQLRHPCKRSADKSREAPKTLLIVIYGPVCREAVEKKRSAELAFFSS